MRPSIPNTTRRQDLKAAIRRAKPDDLLRLEDLARIWGVVKTRFVNIKNDITMTIGFPSHVPGPNNTHLFPAKEALEKLLAWETRNDETSTARQQRAAEILGHTGKGKASLPTALHAPNELAVLNRLAADIEAREREQRLYIPAAEVSATAAEVFSIFSEYCGSLENYVDPNGLLPIDIRKKISDGGHATLLNIHKKLRGLLNADNGTDQPAPRSTRKARSRR